MKPKVLAVMKDLYQVGCWYMKRDKIPTQVTDPDTVNMQELFDWVNQAMAELPECAENIQLNELGLVDVSRNEATGKIFDMYLHEKIKVNLGMLISFKDKDLPKDKLKVWKEYVDHRYLIQ